MNTPTDFDAFINQAWNDHGADAAGVAERLAGQGLALATGAAQVAPLAQLVHHVYGEHLGRWHDGDALLQRLAPLADAVGAAALGRCRASLALCAGDADPRPAMSASDRIRVGAMAAANLVEHDSLRAAMLLQQALDEADGAGLAADDPANRALAVTGNNLACAMETKADRSPAERELMIQAAQAGRRFWALAGGWLETERAEYRLAMTWLQAGDLDQARGHARECLAIVQAQEAAALERFFAWEAIGVVERAAGNAAAHGDAVERARAAFAGLDESDRGWCGAELDKLAASAP
jgi:hypothetical protein